MSLPVLVSPTKSFELLAKLPPGGFYASADAVVELQALTNDWSLRASLASIKVASGAGDIMAGELLSYTYSLAWTVQSDMTGYAPTSSMVWSAWFAPKIATTAEYANFICQNTGDATSNTAAYAIMQTPTAFDALVAGSKSAALLAQGTEITAETDVKKQAFSGVVTTETIADVVWYSHTCSGLQQEGLDGYDKFTVGDKITYRGGFKVQKDAKTAGAWNNGISAGGADQEYTVLDGAIALTVSAAALSSVSSNMF